MLLAVSTVSSVTAASLFQYIDPGAGSLLLQLLLGGLAGAAVIANIYWRKLRGWFGRGNSGERAPDSPVAGENRKS